MLPNKNFCIKKILPVIIIIILNIAAYSNTFNVPFILDDSINITENESIKKLCPPWNILSIPDNTGIVGRPVVNLSLAINYAISGSNPWSYHVVNLLIHISTSLIFLLIIRLVILNTEKGEKYSKIVLPFSFSCAALFSLHPLQTQAVTYTIQRCESLMALFFMLSFYSSIRGWISTSARHWHLLAVLFFLLAIFSKEVAIVLPIILLFYEWVFKKNNILRSLRRSPILYAGLFLGIILAIFTAVKSNTLTSRTADSLHTMFGYWITQSQIIFHYLRLTIWPYGLTIDYGWPVATIREVWPFVIAVVTLIGMTAYTLSRRNIVGFLGACFFLLLAPTSLIPLPDLIFEHRMYLPLAPIIVLFVGLSYRIYVLLKEKLKLHSTTKNIYSKYLFGGAFVFILLLFSFLTYQRNHDYRSEISIYSDTIQKSPNHYRGYHNLSLALSKQGKYSEALENMDRALSINPKNPFLINDKGYILSSMNKHKEAIPYFRKSLEIKPNDPKLHNNLGASLAQTGQLEEAIIHFSIALMLNPMDQNVRHNLALARLTLKSQSSTSME